MHGADLIFIPTYFQLLSEFRCLRLLLSPALCTILQLLCLFFAAGEQPAKPPWLMSATHQVRTQLPQNGDPGSELEKKRQVSGTFMLKHEKMLTLFVFTPSFSISQLADSSNVAAKKFLKSRSQICIPIWGRD